MTLVEVEVPDFALRATSGGEGIQGMFARGRQQAGFRLHSLSQRGISFLKRLFILPIDKFAKNSLLFIPSVHVSFASTLTST